MRPPGTTIDRRKFMSLSGAMLLAAPPVIAGAHPVVQTGDFAFGTSWTARLGDRVDLDRFRQGAGSLLAALDRSFSPYRADSLISRFNSADQNHTEVDAGFRSLTTQALEIAAKSRGTFDPTVGPLVAKYGFGPIDDGSELPNWRALAVDRTGVTKTDASATLDLCGIAKGHALDLLASLAETCGARSGMIEFGGEIIAWGRHPDGRNWAAGIEDPRLGSTGLVSAIGIEDGAIATSGTKVNSYQLGDTLYSHIIDPSRAAPAESTALSASVIAPTASEADGWATALMATNVQTARQIAKQNGLVALLVTDSGTGPVLEPLGGFRAHIIGGT